MKTSHSNNMLPDFPKCCGTRIRSFKYSLFLEVRHTLGYIFEESEQYNWNISISWCYNRLWDHFDWYEDKLEDIPIYNINCDSLFLNFGSTSSFRLMLLYILKVLEQLKQWGSKSVQKEQYIMKSLRKKYGFTMDFMGFEFSKFYARLT